MTGVLKSASLWARSSMVEQWPFKPLVKGSSPFALTQVLLSGGLFDFKSPAKNGVFEEIIRGIYINQTKYDK